MLCPRNIGSTPTGLQPKTVGSGSVLTCSSSVYRGRKLLYSAVNMGHENGFAGGKEMLRSFKDASRN